MRACPAAQRDLPQSHRRLPLPMGRPHLCRRSIRHRNRAAARTFRSQRPPLRPCRPPYPRSTVIRGEQLPSACGLYLRTGLGDQVTYNHKELTVGTITDPNEKRLLGLTLHIESIPLDFWMDNFRMNFSEEIRNKLYRPSSITFEGRGRAHTIFLSWPSDPARVGMVFTLNQGIRNRTMQRLRSRATHL